MRIDKFLKVSRILKRRTLAQEACDKGKVSVNGKDVKPAVFNQPFATGTSNFESCTYYVVGYFINSLLGWKVLRVFHGVVIIGYVS